MKNFRTIWQDIKAGRNLDIYITVILAFFVAILGIFGVANLAIISAAVLATLALVSVSLLQNRRENDSLQSAVSQLQKINETMSPFLGHEPSSYTEQNHLLSSARTVYFWGVSFSRMIPHVRDALERGLKAGLQVRFLILKPNSEAVRMDAFRDPFQDAKRINLALEATISDLSILASKAISPARLEIRVIDYLPPWTIMAFDPRLPNGQVFVSLMTFRSANENRPTFRLKSPNDGEWVRIIIDQFDELWKEAEAIDLVQAIP
jgi:hypothetical protein